MSDKRKLKVFVNPLAFLAVDEPWASSLGKEPTLEDVLWFLCAPQEASDLCSLIARYRKISVEPQRIFAAPVEQRVLSKLIWPLRHAKGCYMVGNYIGTIALCGMVAEMLAILIFDANAPTVPSPVSEKKAMDKASQVGLFGRSFEQLGQERRVSVLRALGLIDEEMQGWFNEVRSKRRAYLHYYSSDERQTTLDAVEAFKATVSLVVKGMGLAVDDDGRLILSEALLKYLEKAGTAESPEGTALRDAGTT